MSGTAPHPHKHTQVHSVLVGIANILIPQCDKGPFSFVDGNKYFLLIQSVNSVVTTVTWEMFMRLLQ